MKAENTFLNITILYAFYGKFTTFSDFKEKIKIFFPKNPPIFFKKNPQMLNVFRNFTISLAFYGKFVTIWRKKISSSERANIVLARAQLANIG